MAAKLAVARALKTIAFEAGVHVAVRRFAVINQVCFPHNPAKGRSYHGNGVCNSAHHRDARFARRLAQSRSAPDSTATNSPTATARPPTTTQRVSSDWR